MKVIDFDFDPDLLRRFLDFPQRLYASDSNWTSDPGEVRLLADNSTHNVRWHNFVVTEKAEICGRVTAIINPRLCDEHDRPYGQLGFFECVNDLRTAHLLVDAAMEWMHPDRSGGTILAPMNFDTWHSYRLRTKGLEQPTFFMEPYNLAYYPTLFSALNFTPISEYVTKTVTNLTALLTVWEPFHHSALARGYTIRTLNLRSINAEVALIYRLSLTIFQENLFFTEISEAEFRALYAGTAGNLDPDLFMFLLDPAGMPVGLSFSIADKGSPDMANVKTFGVLPHVRGEGVGAALAYEVYQRFRAKGFLRVNHCLMRAGNRADGFDGGLGEVTREYSLYSRSF